MIKFFNKTALLLTTKTCEVISIETCHKGWIGRTGKEDDALIRWPPRSPDLTPCDFLFWGFVPPLPANLEDLRNRITPAVALFDRDMLTRVSNEMDYRIDICRITKNGNIEQL